MKPMTIPILAGSLLLAAVPALAASPATSSSYVPASFNESAATQFLNNADWQYNDWSQKMADLEMGILERKVAMNAQAKAELDKAWDGLKASWTRLRAANNNDWDSARASWESASKEMQDAWQHLAPKQS